MIDQANAIGTAALRGRLLPQPYADRTAALFRDYVDSRLQYNAAGSDDAKINAAEERAGQIEKELWDISRTLLTEDPRSQPASLFTQALNEVFDIREERRFALNDRVPAAVTVMLFAVSMVAMGLVGLQLRTDWPTAPARQSHLRLSDRAGADHHSRHRRAARRVRDRQPGEPAAPAGVIGSDAVRAVVSSCWRLPSSRRTPPRSPSSRTSSARRRRRNVATQRGAWRRRWHCHTCSSRGEPTWPSISGSTPRWARKHSRSGPGRTASASLAEMRAG